MGTTEEKTAFFVWPPFSTLGDLPKDWETGLHWHPYLQRFECPECGFEVRWIVRVNDFESANLKIVSDLTTYFEEDHIRQKVPIHPWPGGSNYQVAGK